MGYRETAPPTGMNHLVETAWCAEGGGDRAGGLSPDGCMDLIRMDGKVVVAGPRHLRRSVTSSGELPVDGLRFRPGVLPRLLGVPAKELVGRRVPLDELGVVRAHPETDGRHLASCLPPAASRDGAVDARGVATRHGHAVAGETGRAGGT